MQESLPSNNPLKQCVTTWIKKLKAAQKYKKNFDDVAKEASQFFDGDHNWMWKDAYARGERGYNSNIAPPSFRMQLNKVFELVEIFASVIYHRNPVRTVTVQCCMVCCAYASASVTVRPVCVHVLCDAHASRAGCVCAW